ncbi:MAG: biotin--[acetyl-CoA-carboxylase] ligase [Planctomycetia bacterium]|nr:biotin--[acetyl-CoA-carboxylase] ligase [Planctomycetia bacterium]
MKFATRLHFETLDSTNAFGKRNAFLPLPALITAQTQTAGRGRGERVWDSSPGCLMLTLLFRPEHGEIPEAKKRFVALATAMAIADTVKAMFPDESPQIHWPNDVYLRGKKLSGILLEILPSGVLVLGVGINVRNDLPENLREIAISLRELSDSVTLNEVLERFLKNAETRFRELCFSEKLLSEIDAICWQKGRDLVLHTPQGDVFGHCDGIADDGAILLDGKKYYSERND